MTIICGYHWFIFGACMGGLLVNLAHTPTITYTPPPVQVVAERQVLPAPPIHVLLASMPLHIRDTSPPPVPALKPNLALREAGLQ